MLKIFSGIAIAALTGVLFYSIRCIVFIIAHWSQFPAQEAGNLPFLLFGLTVVSICAILMIYLFLYLGFDVELIKFRSKNS